jgi:hypothetical protein
MLKNKFIRILGLIVAVGLIVQSVIYVYAGIFGEQPGDNIDISAVNISPEIENIIREQEPGEFNKNLNNYKRMLVVLDVHDTFRTEIENCIVSGKRLQDLLIAYQYLNENYGLIDELDVLIASKESGNTWLEVFYAYKQENPEFVPRSFDFNYLEEIMQSDGVIEDDIMIADRVSLKTGLPFESIIAERISGKQWKEINEGYGIINAQGMLPRVPVTQEQLKKHTSGGNISEEMVVETLVIAFKLEMNEQDAINKAKDGYTKERFFAEALENKYE